MSAAGKEPGKRQGERDPGASLQQKLRNYAKAQGDDVSLILTRYINERFLYRLSISNYRDRFILRGATLFTMWNADTHRPTRDIDLLAIGDSSPIAMKQILANICAQPVDADGVAYLSETIRIDERVIGRVYRGLHVEMMTTLGTAHQRLEIDIAFGEAVTPPPLELNLPVLLGMPAPRLRTYQRETVIAEKCEAMVSLGIPNTRMKDFYDLWYLSHAFHFDGAQLCRALQATFTRRNTGYPKDGIPTALTSEFVEDPIKKQQWNAFTGKIRHRTEAGALPQLIADIRIFLQAPLAALAEDRPFGLQWSPDKFWYETETEV